MRRPFVISTGALALALLPAALYAQTPPAAPAQQPPPAQPPRRRRSAKPALAFPGNAGLLLVQVKPDQTATFEEMMKKLEAAFAATQDAALKTAGLGDQDLQSG